ncbi:FBD domain-containing protein [Caenorhabditis elegans]|uniref:FBD domain-containing protein n=2 Tax=Caenorhabditis elegans TaxID=6239 RepID=Q9N2V7_CAEEL|nr:FBD domain-containing protein [Caenorhabditis elegans]CCD73551.1 FBD domain-containing protein [Caenorhabditis elegans]|eukprot:NP_490789.3 High Incidence of Males (increased X chromosome loss) [Caenorhabditis elegans]
MVPKRVLLSDIDFYRNFLFLIFNHFNFEMASSVTTSLNFSNLESPKSNSSSLFEDSLFSSFRWKRTPERAPSNNELVEHGDLENFEYSEPFVIKFHNICKGGGERVNGQPKMDVACQLDDFIEVPIKDAENCLECMTDDRILLDSVEIEVKICTTTCKLAIESILEKYAERRERCKSIVMVKRLVFFIYDLTYAKELAPILARIAPRACIVNLGIPKTKTFPLPPPIECRYVAEFIADFLRGRNAWQTIRVLRVFYFVSLDLNLQKILKKCVCLRHLTLSNVEDVGVFELDTVNSVLLDSCDFSITMMDEVFAEKHPRLFPNATNFGFHRSPISLCLKALKEWSRDRIADTRKTLCFYQPERDFRKFLFEASKLFEVVDDDNELEGEVQIKGQSGGCPLITVFNKDRVYKARI